MTYRLGKLPARSDAPQFRLARFTAPAALPSMPETFGHEGLIGSKGWLMLANDRYGDCVWAGAAHETMMWSRESGGNVLFDTPGVLSDYSACTNAADPGNGFDPKRPETDQVTDMQAAADYRRKTGIIDAKGKRHTIAAHLGLAPGNLDHLYHALYLFGAVGIGIQLPSSALDQTDAGQPWSVVEGSPIEGGHYVALVGRRAGGLRVVTWGQIQVVSESFLAKYCDEARAYVSAEALIDRKSPEGFDYDDLIARLGALK